MTTVTITLRDEDQEFIKAAMKAGRYVTESEAVSDAIAELRARENVGHTGLAEIRGKVEEGLRQLDGGEGTPWTIEEIKTAGRTLLGNRDRVA